MTPTLTVLMTTYHGTSAADFERSVASITDQTRSPDQFLIIVDGPVPDDLDAAIRAAQEGTRGVEVEWLPENLGSGPASQVGLDRATGDFVARQDSDDISLPERLERQMRLIAEHSLDLVGSSLLEFEGSPDNVVGLRSAPETQEGINARLKVNNPINNPSVVFRRELAVRVGGYVDVPYHEDYDLMARLLVAGARAENIAEPLVLFNAGDGMVSRRAGRQMLKHELAMQRRLKEAGVIGPVLFARNLVLRGTFRLLPGWMIRPVYGALFRRDHVPVAPVTRA